MSPEVRQVLQRLDASLKWLKDGVVRSEAPMLTVDDLTLIQSVLLAHAIAPSDILTPKQAAAFLNIPEATLATWRSTNRVLLPYFKLGGTGGHVRYRIRDLEAYIAKQMHNTGAPT